MANAVWPAGLPQFVLANAYTESLPNNTIETPMDAGNVKIRRRWKGGARPFSLGVVLTFEQKQVFEDFYLETLASGSLPFDWVHPITQESVTFRFRQPAPAYNGVTGLEVVCTFKVEKLP